MKDCLHCHRSARKFHGRGLCRRCHSDRSIRARYPITHKNGRRGVSPDFYGTAALPLYATDAQPGSEAKLCVLEVRARIRQQLFHPEDNDGTWPAEPAAELHDRVEGIRADFYARLTIRQPTVRRLAA